ATPTPSCCGPPATSASRRPTTVPCAAPTASGSSPTCTARSCGRRTVGASRTPPSSSDSARRTRSSRATSSRCGSTAGGTTSRVVSCADGATPAERARDRLDILRRSPGAACALDGGGLEMAGSRTLAVPDVVARKGGSPPLVMVTAYDAPSARAVDDAGADIVLVGDSVAMVVLGYDDTLQVTIDDMAHHVGAVARARPRALVVGDMPWLSYHVSTEDTVRNAAALVRAGATAVKLEGGRKRVRMIEAIVDSEIPVMGHLGLTPQSVNALGGFKVQGKQAGAVDE